MSVTTTDNAHVTTVRHILAEYGLHHSQPDENEDAPAPDPNTHDVQPNPVVDNPTGWEDRWRRVPAHRPIHNQLDASRDTYASNVERYFIYVMFGGVNVMATASRWWRFSGGNVNADWFKYRIGGEW